MSDVQARIVELICDKMGYREDRIQPSTRLAEDIGMDGDDAVEFFEKFADEFPGDYAALGRHWHRHFGPEGISINLPTGAYVAVALGVVAGLAAHHWVHWIPGWFAAILAGLACFTIYLKVFEMLHPRSDPPRRPITVQNLIDTANSRKWPLEYTAEDDLLPSYYYPSVVPPRD